MSERQSPQERNARAMDTLIDLAQHYEGLLHKTQDALDAEVCSLFKRLTEAFVELLITDKLQKDDVHWRNPSSLMKDIGLSDSSCKSLLWNAMDLMAQKLADQEKGAADAASSISTAIEEEIRKAAGQETGIQ